jgi:hypothetical protein
MPAVTRRSAVLLAAALAASGAAGCYRPYVLPRPDEPHAMVKVRVAYHSRPGPSLSQLVLINGEAVDIPTPPTGPPGEITRAIPVRPLATRWDVRSTFSHTVTVPEIRHETRTESYSCGSGRTYRTCTRSVSYTRTVMVTRTIVDGHCEQVAGQGPQVGGVYLLQYDFYAHGRCTLACFRQLPNPDGTFQQTPCEPSPRAAP